MASYHVPISDEFSRAIERNRAYDRARAETFCDHYAEPSDQETYDRGYWDGVRAVLLIGVPVAFWLALLVALPAQLWSWL